MNYSATVLPAQRSHIAFAGLCLLLSATLVLVSKSGAWISLELFGGSVLIVVGVSLVLHALRRYPGQRHWLAPLTIGVLVGIFAFSRIGYFQLLIFHQYVGRFGEWVGLSYLILRLIHVIVDSSKLGVLATSDLVAYALFPPALVAGPIHRAEQFLPQLNQPRSPATDTVLIQSLWRIGLGIGKKLVLASALSLWALNEDIARQLSLPRWMLWSSLLAYAFMLYFDFSGYSDIAIGVAGLVGISLPENFANPYAQADIARFWQSWHITLSTWLRDYIFFPAGRALLRKTKGRSVVLIMALANLLTMTVAGLWHGFQVGFILWGVWHGIGLSVHSIWTRQKRIRLPRIAGQLLTFLFVIIGWVPFALGDFNLTLHFLVRCITG